MECSVRVDVGEPVLICSDHPPAPETSHVYGIRACLECDASYGLRCVERIKSAAGNEEGRVPPAHTRRHRLGLEPQTTQALT
jgi:hypothetical protein